MSSAALQVEALARCLDDPRRAGLDGLPTQAAPAIAKVVAAPWAMATGADRRHQGKPLPERLLDRYLDRLLAVAAHDADVSVAFSRVPNLLAAPPSLLALGIAVRVLRPGAARPARVGNPTGAASDRIPATGAATPS